LVGWIDEYENNSVVCYQLGLCPKFSPQIVHVTDDCGECQQIVATIENWMLSNASISVISTYLDLACALIPQWESVCEGFIVSELPQIIKLIEADEDPLTICTTIDVCSSKTSSFVKIN